MTEERVSMLREFKAYMAEHRDFIFTLALLFVADHFLLNGALKGKLEALLHKAVKRIEEKEELTTPRPA